MILDSKTRRGMTRQEIVSYYLRCYALLVDPRTGLLKYLAEELGVHPGTMSDWINLGYIPEFQCRKLHKRFGHIHDVPLDDLCPVEFRN